MSIIAWIAVGLAAGLLANILLPGKRSRGLISRVSHFVVLAVSSSPAPALLSLCAGHAGAAVTRPGPAGTTTAPASRRSSPDLPAQGPGKVV